MRGEHGVWRGCQAMSLERIHNMLKMFVPATGGERGYDRRVYGQGCRNEVWGNCVRARGRGRSGDL